ncbi:MAG: uridine kinase [Oscillospiraceae bacterium]|nr:uridine kinase [Oscillospiraceae bacterium]MBQ3237420.1 uridine kinase [Oscillospiraceae bacterium]MBQ3561564.1 uridine kinase [Oscillospiraceae bacterium]MBQ6699607.1 uridine kinase [Oscillospiraceae bacterium]MBQ6803005.1 uridine kinase [Oscillospiraceae bacterium]
MLVIGIAGGTGSGKTTFTEALVNIFGEKVTVIHHDNYYKVLDHLSYEERCKVNYDHPDSFDTDLMIEHIKKLKNGKSVDEPVYDYTVHNRDKSKTIRLEPTEIIIIDGILILAEKELCDLMDLKIFVDTDADTRLGRRILRDMSERGRSIESVLTQYQTTVKPMHEQFVEPSKKNADIIILEGGRNKAAIDLFAGYIKDYLEKTK